MTTPTNPVLSVVVTVVSDTTEQSDTRHLEGCLEALAREENPPPMEVLVTCDGMLQGVNKLERRFPHVRFIRVQNLRAARYGPSREHHDELRGIGIRESRGELISLLEDHGQPDPHWCARIVEEHRAPHAVIGGAMENGVDRPLSWAVYFCDFGRYQNPVPRGPAPFVSDANVSYKRRALEKVKEAWADSYNETRVHHALRAAGETLWLSPDLIVYQHRLDLRLAPALLERYVWGRSYAVARTARASTTRRWILAALCPILPLVLLQRQVTNLLRTKRNRANFLKSLPLATMLLVAWCYGECVGYLTGRPAGTT